MSTSAPVVYLGRQPIRDRLFQVVAYELLFRSSPDGAAAVEDDSAATAQVIRRAFDRAGIRTVVGDCAAFINVDGPTLLDHAIESLPRDRVVIELLETIPITGEIIHRCRELKAMGYRLALDDFVGEDEACDPLLEIVDIVKIDVLQLTPEQLARLVRRLRRRPLHLLAEKVETQRVANACMAMGFKLFQGFYFGRPAVLPV